MDPIWIALANLGGGFALAVVILRLHQEALKAFREEMATERGRNDGNLGRFFDKIDLLNKAMEESKCRAPMTMMQFQAYIDALALREKTRESGS